MCKSELSDYELDEFLGKCSLLDKVNKRESFEYLLRSIQLDPEQVAKLVENEVVKYSIDLQYSLKKYVKNRYYREAEAASEHESAWFILVGAMGIAP